jgi:hypothetical protein
VSIESKLRDDLRGTLSSIDTSADAWERLEKRLSRESPRDRSRIAAVAVAMTVGIAGLALAVNAIGDHGRSPARTNEPTSVGASSGPPVATRVTQVDVGRFPRGIASGFGFVWVALPKDEYLAPCSGGLARIAPTTDAADVIPINGYPDDVSVGAGAVWLASSVCTGNGQATADSILRVDPASGEVLAVIDTGRYTADVAATDEAVWVTRDIDGRTGEILRIDPATNEVIARIEADGRLRDLVVGEGFVWVVDSTSSLPVSPSLIQIDPDTNTIVRRINGLGDLDVVAGQGALWMESWRSAFDPDVGTGSGDHPVVVRFDPQSGDLLGSPMHIPSSFRPFAAADGGIWFIGNDGGGWTLDWLDTASLDVTRVADLPVDPALDSTVHAALDPENQTIWVANYREGLTRIDFRASEVGPSPVGAPQSTDNAVPDVSAGAPIACGPDDAGTWRTKMAPWLTSALVSVGGPDGQPLTASDINDTLSALQIGSDHSEVVVYVFASTPDLDHDPRPSMVRTGSIGDYALYSSVHATAMQYSAFGPETWLSLYAYASTRDAATRWADDTDVHAWFQDMIARFAVDPMPSC